MKNKCRKFKCKDEIIYRKKQHLGRDDTKYTWHFGIVAFETDTLIELVGGITISSFSNDILPYEGNGYLVGTTDNPNEEVKLEKGDWIMVGNLKDSLMPEDWHPREFNKANTDNIETFNNSICEFQRWSCAVKFSDFNPWDMEETKKHIFYVKEGRIIKCNE